MPRNLIRSDAAIRTAKPTPGKLSRVSDGDGLFLLLRPDGGKLWRLGYSFEGKRQQISLGVYPAVTLATARQRADEARSLVAAGINPSSARKEKKQAAAVERIQAERASAGLPPIGSFEEVARRWHAAYAPTVTAKYAWNVISRLQRFVFPHIGRVKIDEVTSAQCLDVLRRIEEMGLGESARRALSDMRLVFDHVLVEHDPTSRLNRKLAPTPKVRHLAAVTDPEGVGDLMKAISGYHGSVITAGALKLAPMLFVRPGELRRAQWDDIDLDAAEWRYRVTKTDVDHLVPLPSQATIILKGLQAITGNGRYVFPSRLSSSEPMSENTIRAALRRLGYGNEDMTGHGFRAMARTILDEVLGERVDLIEHQLAHAVRDPLGRAYNRTSHLEARRTMMQRWADWLERAGLSTP